MKKKKKINKYEIKSKKHVHKYKILCTIEKHERKYNTTAFIFILLFYQTRFNEIQNEKFYE